MHGQYAGAWQDLADRAGLENAQQFYDHITQTPDQHPKVGTSGMLRGNHNKGKNGWSRRVHYEITGAGRIDYEYHATYKTSADGDEHAVVRILVINLSSHCIHQRTSGGPARRGRVPGPALSLQKSVLMKSNGPRSTLWVRTYSWMSSKNPAVVADPASTMMAWTRPLPAAGASQAAA